MNVQVSKENFLKSAVLVLKDNYGLDLSLSKVTEILDDHMKDEWSNYDYEDVSPYMDTAPHEEIGELVSRHYLGRSWPTYGEKVNMSNFYNDLITAIEKDTK